MPKVNPVPEPQRARNAAISANLPLILRLLRNWLERRRQRRSLKKIPTELLKDVLPDGETSTREQLRRERKRVDTGLWY
ncbi:hypothetical protein [Roseibium sp.]|uniref:hypothetical protein n=1 Tax=Roseibium sp. TaxID=1936156 RepID=UPI003BAD5782